MAVHLNPMTQTLIEIDCIYMKCDSLCGRRFADKISQWIWNFYTQNSQDYNQILNKMYLKDKLTECLRPYFSENGLKFVDIFISGSAANGFFTLKSDIDLCFVISDQSLDLSLAKFKKLQILSEIEDLLIVNNFDRENSEVIDARVPILRYIDKRHKIRVEINVNNENGIRNTRLLYCYSKLDWRVVPVCLYIKTWAKKHKIVDSLNGALSSYTIELMVIFYLQNCCPPVLPCLQKTDYELFTPIEDIMSYQTLPDLTQLTPFESQNRGTLAELYTGFFGYYSKSFDFDEHIVSVRSGRPLDKLKYKPSLQDPNQWALIGVEEPFSRANCARTVYDSAVCTKIVRQFDRWHKDLLEMMASECFRAKECRCQQ